MVREDPILLIKEPLDNRHYAHLRPEHQERHPFIQHKVKSTCLHYLRIISVVFEYHLTHLFRTVKYLLSCSTCGQRSRSQRTPCTAGRPSPSTSWGPKPPARRAGIWLLIIMSMNPYAAPWWPEGYDGAGPSCELAQLNFCHFKWRNLPAGPSSIRPEESIHSCMQQSITIRNCQISWTVAYPKKSRLLSLEEPTGQIAAANICQPTDGVLS